MFEVMKFGDAKRLIIMIKKDKDTVKIQIIFNAFFNSLLSFKKLNFIFKLCVHNNK